jgi:hypothetical protein
VGFFSVPAGYRIIKAEELYPGMTGSGASGSAMQLPCPSLDEYDELDDDNEYAEADQMEEYTEGLGGTDDGDEDPNLAEEISGAAIDDAEQTAAEEMGEQVKDSVSKGLKKIFGN